MARPKLKNIDPTLIDAEGRFREDYGDLDDLKESITEKGVIQPITVRDSSTEGRYQLLAGGRRLRATLELGLRFIPCLLRVAEEDMVEVDSREIELLENIERKDFTWQERSRLVDCINKLYTEKTGGNWSGRKTADLLGRSHGGVNRQLQLASALDAVPVLGECKTEDEAFRKMKKLEEAVLMKQLEKRLQGQATLLSEAVDSGEVTQEEIDASPSKQAIQHYDHAKNHYIVGDTFAGLREYIELQKGNSPIYFIDSDPPFAVDLLSQKKGITVNEALEKYVEVAAAEYEEWLNKLCPLLYDAAGKHCWMTFWFGPTWDREVREALTNSGWHVDHIPAVWVKGEEESEGSGQTASPDTYLARATEFFYVCRKGDPVFNNQGVTNVFSHRPLSGKRKYHPTQKPVTLYKSILETFSLPSAITLIPFLGSGSALKAAYATGRTGFGWELNESNKTPFLATLGELVENNWEE